MTVDRISPPKVTLSQQSKTTNPTVQTPVQMPCAVGPCFYKLDAVDSNNSANTNAVLQAPASAFSANAGPYVGLGGTTIQVKYKDYPAETVEFPSSVANPSAAYVASTINDAGLTGVKAKSVKDDSGAERVMIYTSSVGSEEEFQLLTGSPDGLAVLGFNPGRYYYSMTRYEQWAESINEALFPDPDGKLKDINIIEDDIRMFLMTGPNSLYELKTDRSFLRYFDYVILTGQVDLDAGTYPDDFIDKTFTMSVGTESQKSVQLLNTVKSALIIRLNEACEKFTNHKLNSGGTYHNHVDDKNAISASYPLPQNASLSTVLNLVISLSDAYSDHLGTTQDSAGQTVHIQADTANGLLLPLNTWSDVVTYLNEFDDKFDAHIADTTFHDAADSDNGITSDDVPSSDSSTIVSELGTAWPSATFALNASNYLTIIGTDGMISVEKTDGSDAILGADATLSAHVMKVVDDDDGDAQSPKVEIHYDPSTQDPTYPGTTAHITAGTPWSGIDFANSVVGKTLILSVDGEQWQTITFSASATTSDQVIAEINAVMGDGTASDDGGNLEIISGLAGTESVVKIDTDSTADFGFTTFEDRGNSYPIKVGYEVWTGGEMLGTIVSILDVDDTNGVLTVKLDKEFDLGKGWSSSYIYAAGLKVGTSGEPLPDLVIDGTTSLVKHEILRDHRGYPVTQGGTPLIVSYRGLRLDISTDAENPTLWVFDDEDEIESVLGPATPENPLSFMVVNMKAGGPNVQVAAIGVNEVTDDAPEGTLKAYRKAFNFLKSWNVYYITPATFEYPVHQALLEHVNAENDEEQAKFRVGMCCIKRPERKADVAVVSGADGESAGVNSFDTKMAGLPALLMSAGVDVGGGLTIDDGVYLDVEADDNHYLISSVNGSVVTIDTTFSSDENGDGFFSTSDLPATLLQQSFTVFVRGQEISTAYDQAVAYQEFGKGLKGKMVLTCPDYLQMPVNGVDTLVEGYYATAVIAGLAAQLAPQQPMSGMAVPGFTSAIRSFPYFNEDQMNIIAGGGVMILWQEKPGTGSVLIRHQLMTNTDDIKTREFSVVRALDFFSTIITAALKPHVGKHNINGDGFNLDMLVDAAVKFAVDQKVVVGAKVKSIEPSDTQIDRVKITIDVDLFIPGNTFAVTVYM